ncbi:hypothetical protein BD770DRAFT_439967 [Pilaira anomala]|nr:hypothetical protein BD770DRAFT_439967 [Pilaira anomala]
MKHIHLLVVFFITLLEANVESKELNPRTGQTCAFLSNKIYCFGGIIDGSIEGDVLNSLDISKNVVTLSSQLNSLWEDVKPLDPTSVITGRRWYPQSAVTPDGKRLLIQGGFNFDTKPMVHQTIAYNSETNTWEALANYNDNKNGGDREMYFGTGEYIPSLNSFGFFGGRQAHAVMGSQFTTPDNKIISNLTYTDTDGNILSRAGFQYLTLFDIKTNTWNIPLPQTNVPSIYRVAFSATYHPGTKKMFYIGGSHYDEATATYIANSMVYATVFDTVKSAWSEEPITGTPPSLRNHHTTTLLPNGNDILLYGGELVGSKALDDYCFTLHVPNMSWKKQNLIAPIGLSGPRSQHSAVLVNNASLFILFGTDVSAKPMNQLLVLNVRDENNITFSNNFIFENTAISNNRSSSNPSSSNPSSSNPSSSNPSSFTPGSVVEEPKKGLSKGSIAGIVVGCIIAVALTILGLVCCLRRKKNKQKDTEPASTLHSEPNETKEIEGLEVDWDKIENRYKEVEFPPSKYQNGQQQQQQQQQINSPQQQHYASNDIYSEADSSTVTSSYQPPHTPGTSKSIAILTGASPINPNRSKPSNTEPISPDVVTPVVKPNVADIIEPSILMKHTNPGGSA